MQHMKQRLTPDTLTRSFVSPTRIVWETNDPTAAVESAHVLLEQRDAQATLRPGKACVLRNKGSHAGLLLDFGVELNGGIQIVAWNCSHEQKRARLRVRFGESAMEAMSELGGEQNATNDHAIRDQIVDVSFLGRTDIGNTGFRFVRIDLLDDDCMVELKTVRAVFTYRDLEYKGSFQSSDALLNEIWQTGAYTVHLNMQDCLWDGIKRDRLVWIGDMHPETSTIQAVFGADDIVPRSLDLIRDDTPLPEWMNGFPSYSLWWILILHDWHLHTGNDTYLKEQKTYLMQLLQQLMTYIRDDGTHELPNPFLDWPSSNNPDGVAAGIHALFVMGMQKGAVLLEWLDEASTAHKCRQAEATLRKHVPDAAGSKQAAALLALAGVVSADEANNDVLAVDGAERLSTFLGYYVLKARAEAADIVGSLNTIREYWGGMLQLGATTFWEDFDVRWLKNAARIDELTPEGKVNVHGEYGDHCYQGYRHSLCHGWASGPTAFLSEYVLGIRPLAPGCQRVSIRPNVGDLEWVEGTYPTPFGTIYVKCEKEADGTVRTTIDAPEAVEVVEDPSP